MYVHVTQQETGVNAIDRADAQVGVRIQGTGDAGDVQVLLVDRVITTREVTTRAIVSYTDPQGVRHNFERDMPGEYILGGPRMGGGGYTYYVTLAEEAPVQVVIPPHWPPP